MNRIQLLVSLALVAAAACLAQPEPPKPGSLIVSGPRSSFLGVGVVEIDSERAKELKLKEEHGVEVKNVADESPASKAGVKVGDVVLEYNGQRVEGAEQFVRLVHETPVGRNVKLLISRNGSNQTLVAAIGSRSAASFFPSDGKTFAEAMSKLRTLEMPDLPYPTLAMQSRALGVECESLGSQLAEYFGVKEGVLVRSVVQGSAAEKAGIKAGDVITKVGDRKVTNPSELSNAIRSAPGATVPVTAVRNQKELSFSIPVQKRSSERVAQPVAL